MASSLSMFGAALHSAPSSRKTGGTPEGHVLVAYGLFLGFAGIVFHFVAEGRFSSIVTMAEILKCLAMLLLNLQSLSSGSAAGISALSVALEALSICLQLSSTLWLNGYLPVDASGDWIFQAVDVVTVVLALALLARMLGPQRRTYCEDGDTMPLVPLLPACFVLAALLHGNQVKRPIFDALWMAGLFVGVAAVLPQLWLASRSGGKVEALTSHFIAMTALSRLLTGIFWWYAASDMEHRPWIPGFNHVAWAILGAHAVHILLLADFAYVYVKGVATAGLCALSQDMMV